MHFSLAPRRLHSAVFGDYRDAQGNRVGLVSIRQAGTWAPPTSPTPASAYAGVSCSDGGHCVVVGHDQRTTRGLVLIFDWDTCTTPRPSGVPSGESRLKAVDCSSSTTCTAAGELLLDAGGIRPLSMS